MPPTGRPSSQGSVLDYMVPSTSVAMWTWKPDLEGDCLSYTVTSTIGEQVPNASVVTESNRQLCSPITKMVICHASAIGRLISRELFWVSATTILGAHGFTLLLRFRILLLHDLQGKRHRVDHVYRCQRSNWIVKQCHLGWVILPDINVSVQHQYPQPVMTSSKSSVCCLLQGIIGIQQ